MGAHTLRQLDTGESTPRPDVSLRVLDTDRDRALATASELAFGVASDVRTGRTTTSLADLIAANPGTAKPGMSIADVKRALIDAQGVNVNGSNLSPRQRVDVMEDGKRVWIAGTPQVKTHVPVTTVDDALDLADAMARYGNYPAGLDACFAAGINGDAGPDGECIFAGTPTCTCDAEHYAAVTR